MQSASNPVLRANSLGSYRKTIKNYSYFLADQIGKGYSSTVYIGQNDSTLEKVAIKVIQLKFIKDFYFKQMLENELQCMKKVRHPRILRLIDTYSTNNNIYIISEYCEGGDLQRQLKTKGRYNESELIEFLSQFYPAYSTLLEAGFIHRDLKPANILLKRNKIRIADFGIVKKVTQPDKVALNIGTLAYMSPQSIFSNIFNEKTDVWSIGVMCYQLVHGRLPWKSNLNDRQSIKLQIMNTSIAYDPNLISIGCIKFISQCLQRNPLIRLSIRDFKDNPWFQQFVITLIKKKKEKKSSNILPAHQLIIKNNDQASSSLSKIDQKQSQWRRKYQRQNQSSNFSSQFDKYSIQNNKNSENTSKKISFCKFTYSNSQNQILNSQQSKQAPSFHKIRERIQGFQNELNSNSKQKLESKNSYVIVSSFLLMIGKLTKIKQLVLQAPSLAPHQQFRLSEMLRNFLRTKTWQINSMIIRKENLFSLKDWESYQLSQEYNTHKFAFLKLIQQINESFSLTNGQNINENYEKLIYDQLFSMKNLIEKMFQFPKQSQLSKIMKLMRLAELLLSLYEQQRATSTYLNDRSNEFLLSYLSAGDPELKKWNTFQQKYKEEEKQQIVLSESTEKQLKSSWIEIKVKIEALF